MGSSLRELDPRVRPYAEAFVQYLRDVGLGVEITSVHRTTEEQANMHASRQGCTDCLPSAPPGHSLHERRLAWDMVIVPRSLQTRVGHAWERLGGRWGGRFRDPVHFDWGLHPV